MFLESQLPCANMAAMVTQRSKEKQQSGLHLRLDISERHKDQFSTSVLLAPWQLSSRTSCTHTPHSVVYLLWDWYVLYHIPNYFLFPLQCSPHTFSGGSNQRRAGGSGAAGLWGATRARRRLWGRGAGRAAEETSRAQSPQRSQPSP